MMLFFALALSPSPQIALPTAASEREVIEVGPAVRDDAKLYGSYLTWTSPDLSVQGIDLTRAPAGSQRLSSLPSWNDPFVANGRYVAIAPLESSEGRDLNGDGDLLDRVSLVYDQRSQGFLPGVATGCLSGRFPSGSAVEPSEFFVFLFDELGEANDVNQNGIFELLPAAWHLPTGTLHVVPQPADCLLYARSGNGFFATPVQEAGQDLNGDGDGTDTVMWVVDASTGNELALGVAVDPFNYLAADGRTLVFTASEVAHGSDLNGDGDMLDRHVAHVYDADTGVLTNLGVAVWSLWASTGWVDYLVEENQHGDLNGDGDTLDRVPFVYDPATGTSHNLGHSHDSVRRRGSHVALRVYEDEDGADLNGDGDLDDRIWILFDLVSGLEWNTTFDGPGGAWSGGRFNIGVSEYNSGDLNGDGDATDTVEHLLDITTGAIHNLGFAVNSASQVSGGMLYLRAREGNGQGDLNGDGDEIDLVLQLVDIKTLAVHNVGLWASNVAGTSRHVGFAAFESQNGRDLNGDGDLDDEVFHLWERRSGKLTNLGYSRDFNRTLIVNRRFAVFLAQEPVRNTLHAIPLQGSRSN